MNIGMCFWFDYLVSLKTSLRPVQTKHCKYIDNYNYNFYTLFRDCHENSFDADMAFKWINKWDNYKFISSTQMHCDIVL